VIFSCSVVAQFPSLAFAQPEDGIFVDPDSPAGKEYAIPLEQARSEGVGEPGGAPGTVLPRGSGSVSSSGPRPAPLFGRGIRRADRGRGGGKARQPPARTPVTRGSAAILTADADTPPLAAIAAALIALGAGLGFGLRRLTGIRRS
jgi:hypothetical protein